MYDRFDDEARRALVAAGLDAGERDQGRLDTDGLLFGVAQATPALAERIDPTPSGARDRPGRPRSTDRHRPARTRQRTPQRSRQ